MPPVYLAHTNQAVFVGPTGHQHIRSTSPDDERPTVINCVECEKYLVRDHGAVYSPDQVPLTEKQLERKDREQRDGNAAVAEAAKALAANARAQLAPAAAGGRVGP